MNVEEKSAGQENAKLVFAKQHLIRKLKFHIFNFMAIIPSLSFIAHVILFLGHLQSLIPHFSKI